MTLPHFSASLRVSAPNSSGVIFATSTAMSAILFFTSGRNRMRLISAFSLVTMVLGMHVALRTPASRQAVVNLPEESPDFLLGPVVQDSAQREEIALRQLVAEKVT